MIILSLDYYRKHGTRKEKKRQEALKIEEDRRLRNYEILCKYKLIGDKRSIMDWLRE